MAKERLQKYLARCGWGSRRHCEDLIRGGRVEVNGEPAPLGTVVDPDRDEVRVDGLPARPLRPTYLLLHKPPGFLSAVCDPRGRRTVLDLVPAGLGVYPVGRLDYDASGALLLTNDGALAYRLTHPRFQVPRAYRALVRGIPSPQALSRLERGVILAGKRTAPAHARLLSREGEDAWIELTLREGRYHQVKRMCQAVGHPVLHLERVRLGPLRLGRLPPGRFRFLTEREVKALRAAVGLGSRQDPPAEAGREGTAGSARRRETGEESPSR